MAYIEDRIKVLEDRVSTIEDIIETDGEKLDTLGDRFCKLYEEVTGKPAMMPIQMPTQVQQTTEDFVRVRHGKWEYDAETAGFKCTACGKRIYGMTLEIGSGDIKYCPNCGARMEEVEE